MKKTAGTASAAGISSEAVQKATGKGWNEWFAILDKANASQWSHKEIAAYLHDQCGCPPWWSQMVTVGYEQERGLRQVHEKTDGFSANASKTINAPLARLYAAWDDRKKRGRWLKDVGFTVRKATENKSMRVTWIDEKTSVEVNFYAKGEGKSQVTVQHNKLGDAKDVEKMKAYWGEALEKLKAMLEK